MINLFIKISGVTKLAHAAIVADGLWTGHDWYDSTNKIGVKNGVPYSDDSAKQRELTAPLSLDGSINDNYT